MNKDSINNENDSVKSSPSSCKSLFCVEDSVQKYEESLALFEAADFLGSLLLMVRALNDPSLDVKASILNIEESLKYNPQQLFKVKDGFEVDLIYVFVALSEDEELSEKILRNKDSEIVKMIDSFLDSLSNDNLQDISERSYYEIDEYFALPNILKCYSILLKQILDLNKLSEVEIKAVEDQSFCCEMPIFEFEDLALNGKKLANVSFSGDARFSFFKAVPHKFNEEQKVILNSLLEIGHGFEEKCDEAKLVFKVRLRKINELFQEQETPKPNKLQISGSYRILQEQQQTNNYFKYEY